MTTRRRRRFTTDFKKRVALEALQGDRTVQKMAARHEIHPNQVSLWKRQAIQRLDEGLCRRPSLPTDGTRGDDSGPACEDRRVDGGARFCSTRFPTLSRAVRLSMVERDGTLSISRR